MPLDNGIRFSSLNCEPFSKRCFSQLSRGKIGIEKIGVSDARSGSGGGKSWFNKHRKRNNAVSARGKSNATSSSISADVNAVNSTSEQLVGDGVERAKPGSSVSNTKQNSKPRARQQQQSRSKKKKEQLSATVASEQASVGKSCKSVSLAKSSKCKSEQCADLTSEVSSPYFSSEIRIYFLLLSFFFLFVGLGVNIVAFSEDFTREHT